MGVYDSVMVPCPVCGTVSEFQSKSGECLMREYTLEECPQDVLGDVNRHAPNVCEQCKIQYYVHIIGIPKVWGK